MVGSFRELLDPLEKGFSPECAFDFLHSIPYTFIPLYLYNGKRLSLLPHKAVGRILGFECIHLSLSPSD